MKTMKAAQALTASICAVALSVTAINAANATPVKHSDTISFASSVSVDSIVFSDFNEDEAAQAMHQLLSYFSSIPDDVLERGDNALTEWQKQNPVPSTRASVLGCIGAVLWLVGSNVIGVAKILKIKKLIDKLGGVAEAVKIMWGASFKWEKMQAAGGALAELGTELLGIAGVKEQCFN